jgi:flagellar biosynthesis protein FlhA
MEGVQTKDPTYGLPATWIKESDKEKAMARGHTVVDLSTVLLTHLSDIIKRHSHEILGRQEVQHLIETIKESHPQVVEELIPNQLPLGAVVKVLQNLLKEQVPVRDLLTILETLADWSPMVKDIDLLTEKVRQSLARTITRTYQTPDGSIPLITLDPRTEKALTDAVQHTEQGSYLAVDPAFAQKVLNAVSEQLKKLTSLNYQPVALCSAPLRTHFRKLTEQVFPHLAVLSHNDLLPEVNIQSLGVVGVGDAN